MTDTPTPQPMCLCNPYSEPDAPTAVYCPVHGAKPQPDLSDEGLRKLAEAMFDMDMDESAQALLEVRDQARAAERSSKPVQYRYVNEERIQVLEAEQKALKAEIAAERKKTLLWVLKRFDESPRAADVIFELRRAAEEGGKDA